MFSIIFFTLTTANLLSAVKLGKVLPEPKPVVDAVAIYHTDDKNLIKSGASVFPETLHNPTGFGMQWSGNYDSSLHYLQYNSNPYLLKDEGWLIGNLTITVNGRTVISIVDSSKTCYESERWIPGNGIYLYKEGKWKTMYYFPHFYPQVLS
ncbi:hypothetical protein GCK32_012918 [Trichostrongylus colubriformis]|uniref:Uncharacterized protein n=1 Tax=Trichostrongylus colubriformis TaxID=6319 RepID=A0AAN8ERY2_TRICO